MGNPNSKERIKEKKEKKEKKSIENKNKKVDNEEDNKENKYERSYSVCEPININDFKNKNINNNINDKNKKQNNSNNDDANDHNQNKMNKSVIGPICKNNDIIKQNKNNEMKNNNEEKKEKKLIGLNRNPTIKHCDTNRKLLGGYNIEKYEKKNDLNNLKNKDLKLLKNDDSLNGNNKEDIKEKKIEIDDELLNNKENKIEKISRNLNENYMTENNNNNFMQTERNFYPKKNININFNEKDNNDILFNKEENISSNQNNNNKNNLNRKNIHNSINERKHRKREKNKIYKTDKKKNYNIQKNESININENIVNNKDNMINKSINLNINENIVNNKDNIINKKDNIINNNNLDNNNTDNNINVKINEQKLTDNIENEEDKEIKFSQNLNIGNIIIEKNLKIPNYFSLFENIDIFNSILIILNNNTFINEYFLKEKIKKIIYNCENNNLYCLSSILYHMSKYLWNSKEKYMSEKDLKLKYLDFIKCYIESNCNNTNLENYCYNLENLILIIDFIYQKINSELTAEYTRENYINNIPIRNSLSSYINEFKANYYSKISDHFMGFYENQKICSNCQNKINRVRYAFNNYYFNNNDITEYSYDYYFYINFNLNEIIKYMPKNNNVYNNIILSSNYIQYINLENCFDYEFNKKNKKYCQHCNRCFLDCYFYEYKIIYTLPTIITIVLSNNYENNFIIYDQINLENYVKKKGDGVIYNIVSILCQMTYNGKFICYCINPNNGNWYAYSDKGINEVEKMDLNAKPLVLFYQKQNTILKYYNYKVILRDDSNKIFLDFKFINGMSPLKLFFNKNILIKDIIGQILLYYNLKNAKLTLIINGKRAQNEQTLSNFLENNQNKAKVTVNIA